MIIQLFISLLWLTGATTTTTAAPKLAMPGCIDKCGKVDIPYPFGIGNTSCYHNEWYEITCNASIPFLRKLNLEVLQVRLRTYSYLRQTVTVNSPIVSDCETVAEAGGGSMRTSVDLSGSPFNFSQIYNKFTVVGCSNVALLSGSNNEVLAGCTSICNDMRTRGNGCYGINCCQTFIPDNLKTYIVNITRSSRRTNSTSRECKYAFLVDGNLNSGNFSSSYIKNNHLTHVPVVMTWTIFNPKYIREGYFSDYGCLVGQQFSYSSSTSPTGWQCACRYTYQGNPYIPNGCQVVEACADCKGNCIEISDGVFKCRRNKTLLKVVILGVSIGVGLLLFLLGGFWMYKVVKRRKEIKLKEKFFKKNGGLLLQQQILSDDSVVERTKIFTSKELEMATDNFNENRILGEGGQGTVYKGMLIDGKIVAIKRSKIVDEGQIEQFINEMVILSQINHRNVVTLLGCCLETEVPLLVYEFIPNGTLFQHIHDPNEEFLLSWEMRLQIATEVAGALGYLHSASSMPIYHRDIKSANILLDDKYRAKVADFGISRSIAIEQTHLTTHVQGTFGYLDPEYFQSSQFTEKSDVYSFGVVLVELLTSQKPISSNRSQEERSLATHFVLSVKESRLFNILDARVITEGRKEELITISNLAKRCLRLTGKKRPTMKEVATELEGIRMSHVPAMTPQNNFLQIQYGVSDVTEISNGASTSMRFGSDYTTASSPDNLPVLINTI